MSRERDLNSEPTRRQRRNIDLPPNPSRRRFFIAAATGILAAGAGALAIRPWEGKSEIDKTLEEYERNAQKINRVIDQADLSMANLRKITEDVLLEVPSEERDVLMFPIDVYDGNRSNKYRNIYDYRIEEVKDRGPEAVNEEFFPEDPFQFSFDFLPENAEHAIAAFVPARRIVGYKEGFENDSLFNSLVTYHEMMHVIQTAGILISLKSDRDWEEYYDFFSGGKRNVVGDWEQEAYLLTLDLLNAITHGDLKADMEAGKINVNYYARFLGVSKDQLPSLRELLEYGRIAYETGTTFRRMAPEFVSAVNNNLRARGLEVFSIVNGKFVPSDL